MKSFDRQLRAAPCGLRSILLGRIAGPPVEILGEECTPSPSGPARRTRWGALAALAALVATAASPPVDPPSWTQPTQPFRTVGNIYYVGTKGLASYLIVSNRGLVLLDGTLAENVPAIEENIRRLGYRLRDVRILLNSHAHFDHAAGLARLKRDTGAVLLASAGDRSALEAGRPTGQTDYGVITFPPVAVDRTLVDGAPVRLGDVALAPVLTPGHTPGCTTWRMRVMDGGRPLDVVFLCSVTVAGNLLVGNREYPGIVEDFRNTFRRISGLRADVVLTAHPEVVDVMGRADRRAAGDRDAYLMPGMLQRLDEAARSDFEKELARQRSKPGGPGR